MTRPSTEDTNARAGAFEGVATQVDDVPLFRLQIVGDEVLDGPEHGLSVAAVPVVSD